MRCSGPNERRVGGAGRWLIAVLLCGLGGLRAQEPEPWTKVVAEHFTILTPADESVARRWAIELEQFRRGLQSAVPVPVERLRPVTVVLFPNDRAMEPFLPLEKGKPARLGGSFVRANDINTIMLSLARNAGETRRVIFHEAVHWHLTAREGIMPLWLGEGLAEVYATFEVLDRRNYAFGAAMEEHVRRLREETLLPLPKLVGIGRDSLLYNEGTRASIFYAQAWAFVHFILFGQDSPGRDAVQRYLDLLPKVRSPDDAFVQAFGADYATLDRRLRDYIENGRYHKHLYPRATGDISRQLKISVAAPADVELAKGSLLLAARSAEDAEPHLWRAAELAPEDPRAWELLGHTAAARKDFARAREVLARAAAAGSKSYLVYHNLAVSRLPELGSWRLPGNSVDPQAMDLAAADFRQAIRLAPSNVASYEGLAGMMHGMATVVPGDVDLLHRGLAQAPGNTMIEAGIAAGELRAGQVETARARLAELCARHPTSTDAGMVFARRLLESETLRLEIDEINRLTAENRLDDVIAIADRALSRSLELDQMMFMQEVRRRMLAFKRIHAAVELANRGQSEAARAELQDVLASAPDRTVATEANRLLQEIAKVRGRTTASP